MRQALKPFHNPKLRDVVLGTKRSLEQVIDEQTPDKLLRAGFDAAALENARSLLTSFKQFIEDHKDEIDALKVLYSQPYRAGLRYSQVKELAKAIKQPPHSLYPERLWSAYETVEPENVKAHGGKQLVDVIALVRHAIDPDHAAGASEHDRRRALPGMARRTGKRRRSLHARTTPLVGRNQKPHCNKRKHRTGRFRRGAVQSNRWSGPGL